LIAVSQAVRTDGQRERERWGWEWGELHNVKLSTHTHKHTYIGQSVLTKGIVLYLTNLNI